MSLTNDPKVLVEFSPEEIVWLADRLHEFRSLAVSATLKAAAISAGNPEAEEKFRNALEEVDKHKKMEATIRNRLVDKASEQGFGDL